MKTRMISVMLLTLVWAALSSTFEDSLIAEMNLVRENPSRYAERFIVPLLNRSTESISIYPSGLRVRSKEGLSLIIECMSYLDTVSSTHHLSSSRGLALGARDHALDQSVSGQTGHRGGDGSYSETRVNRYGRWRGATSEDISYGLSSPRDIIISLLIDDGFESRGHRLDVLSSEHYKMGAYSTTHPRIRNMCVITLAVRYEERY